MERGWKTESVLGESPYFAHLHELMESLTRHSLARYEKSLLTTRPITPMRRIEEWKEKGSIKDALSTIIPVRERSLGGRIINLFYGDFIFWLKDEFDLTEEDFYDELGGFHTNCSQYSSFMGTLLHETLPELSPTLSFGDARVLQGGVFNDKRVEHFWVNLGSDTILDNSGINSQLFSDYRVSMSCMDFAKNTPEWELDHVASMDGGWLNTEVKEFCKQISLNSMKNVVK